MRFITVLTVAICFMLNSNAQIVLEHTYTFQGGVNQEFFLANLGYDNYKYVIYNYDSAKFSLFNLDHSPYLLNVPIPVISNPATNTYYRLGYITLDLFDCDSSNIEYAMMLNTPREGSHPNFAVYRTDGTILFEKDTVGTLFCIGCGSGSYETHPIMNTPEGAKLYLFNNDSLGNERIFVYQLCGTNPILSTIDTKENIKVYLEVNPNPAFHEVNFMLSNKEHLENLVLDILDSEYRLVKSLKVFDSEITIQDASLAPGVYYYTLHNSRSIFRSGKFIYDK